MIALAITLPATSQPITFMIEDMAPMNFVQENQTQGIAVDLILDIYKEAKMPLSRTDIKVLPWPRAYDDLQKIPNTSLFSMAKTAERELLFKFSDPIYKLTIGLVAQKSKKVAIHSPADFAKYKIGTIINGAPEQLLIKAGADSTKLDRTAMVDGNILKLQGGRIDAFAINVLSAQYEMKKKSIPWDEYEIVYILKEGSLCYAFHKDVDQKTIDAINAAMAKVKTSGAFDSIVKKYL